VPLAGQVADQAAQVRDPGLGDLLGPLAGLDQLRQRILLCGPLLGQVLQRPGLIEQPLCVTAAQDDHGRVLHAVHVAGRGQPGHLLAGLIQLALQADHLAQGDLRGVLGVVQASWWFGLMVACAGLLAALALTVHCVRRLGGITGDVLGAGVELTLLVMLLVALA